jgi:hypothetical protein
MEPEPSGSLYIGSESTFRFKMSEREYFEEPESPTTLCFEAVLAFFTALILPRRIRLNAAQKKEVSTAFTAPASPASSAFSLDAARGGTTDEGSPTLARGR